MIKEIEDYEEISLKGYKYMLVKDVFTQTRIKGYDIATKYIRLMACGNLILKKGYATDASSGPTIDDDTNIHAGFAHDGLYQLMRIGKFGIKKKDFKRIRKLSDLTFYDQLKKDGMPWIRRNYYYQAVRWFGAKHARPREQSN